MTTPRTSTATLAQALDVLARDIQSEDGVANAAIQEAAQRLRELGNLELFRAGAHLGETPRTDRALIHADCGEGEALPFVSSDFARELERELTAAIRRISELETALFGPDAEIERLERENARLRDALRFYADPQSYGIQGGHSNRIMIDAGARAKLAMKEGGK